MGAFMWLGGSVLGLILVDWIQRWFFPGDPLVLTKWKGRTRCRETRKGGSIVRTALSFFPGQKPSLFSLPKSLQDFCRQSQRIPLDWDSLFGMTSSYSREELEKRLQEEERPSNRALFLCLLAYQTTQEGQRENCLPYLEDAEAQLQPVWEPQRTRVGIVYQHILRLRAIHHYQNGDPQQALHTLAEAETRFSIQTWTTLLKVETFILIDQRERALALVNALLEKQSGHSPEGKRHRMSALLLKGELLMRAHQTQKLERLLSHLSQQGKMDPSERIAWWHLKMERDLHRNDLPSAWRSLSAIHQVCCSWKKHPGFKRIFHLACARVYLEEEAFREAAQHLDSAESLSLYPLAHWEAQLMRGSLYELEENENKGREVWTVLAEQAAQTFYGQIAQARLERTTPKPTQLAPIYKLFAS